MTAEEHKSDYELTKDTPYPTLTGELWGVCCEDMGENWSCYNGTTLYLRFMATQAYVIMCIFFSTVQQTLRGRGLYTDQERMAVASLRNRFYAIMMVFYVW